MNKIEEFLYWLGVVDTETTGTTNTDDVIEFSIMMNQGSEPTYFTSYFKTNIPVPPESSAVHWISDEDLTDAPTFESAASTIGMIMDQMQYLVGHNVEFDRQMIAQNYARKNITVPNSVLNKQQWICTHKIAKKLFGQDTIEFDNFKLGYLWFKLGLNKLSTRKINPHKAEDDVYMCYMLLISLLNECINRGIVDPNKDIGVQLHKFSTTPNILEVYPYGKYKGTKFKEVFEKDRRYLEWMVTTSDLLNPENSSFDEDFAATIEYYLS
ncbi:RNase [Xanthomonas phage XaC1]|nr:RNase [Xanthomonas phage XaC1]